MWLLSREQARRWVGELLPVYPLFRAAWQITAKPCITFPAPPLKFRTAGFPQYGYKAGLSDGAFPRTTRSLPSSFVLSVTAPYLRSMSKLAVRSSTTVQATSSLYPRGPRSGAGYVVPHPHRLVGLIRPTCRHIVTSPHCGLYPMPSPGRLATRARKWFRAFAARSFATCRPLRPRRARRCYSPSSFTDHSGLRQEGNGSALSIPPPSASGGKRISGLHWFTFATACCVASLLGGSDQVSPAPETFTSGLPTRRSPFTLPDMTTVVSGHSPPTGLSPAGTAASIAALPLFVYRAEAAAEWRPRSGFRAPMTRLAAP